MRLPVNEPFQITTEFGVPDPNAYFGYHSGTDYAVATLTPVYAPEDSTVWSAGWSNTGGNMIILFDGKYFHRLMHNERMLVSTGQQVTEGQHIADAGSTGMSSGPHVHWDIATEMTQALRPSSFSKFINPELWIKQGGNMDVQKEIGELYKLVDAANKEIEKLYGHLNTANERIDALESAPGVSDGTYQIKKVK